MRTDTTPRAGAARRPLPARGAVVVPMLLVVLLLPLTALCLRALGPGKPDAANAGPLGTHAALSAAVSFVGLGGLAWWYRQRTARREEWGPTVHPTVGARLDAAIGALLAIAAIATPLALLVFGGRSRLVPRRPHALPTTRYTPRPTEPQQTQRPVPQQKHLSTGASGPLHVLVVVLAVVVVVVVVAGVLWAIGRVFGWWHRDPAASPGAPLDTEEDEALSDAVEAAAGELRRLEDVRAAIIACYAAMESTLRAAGVPRLAADSPEELLVRAAGHGTIDTPAAAELTRLFGEARYSTHPLTERHREAAETALETIRVNLRERAARAASAWAEAAR